MAVSKIESELPHTIYAVIVSCAACSEQLLWSKGHAWTNVQMTQRLIFAPTTALK